MTLHVSAAFDQSNYRLLTIGCSPISCIHALLGRPSSRLQLCSAHWHINVIRLVTLFLTQTKAAGTREHSPEKKFKILTILKVEINYRSEKVGKHTTRHYHFAVCDMWYCTQ